MRDDWIECKLDEACGVHDNLRKPINSKERTKRIEGKSESELYPYFGATGKVGLIDDYLTDGEYVLIGEDGAPFFDYSKNVAYLINGKTWVNNHAHVLLSHFNNKFLLFCLNQFNFHGYVSGTTRLKLTQTSLKKLPIPLAPLPEQRAIVAKIEQLFSDLDNGISNLKSAKEKLTIYRQAVLKKAFEGELTKEWRAKQTDLPTASELLEQIKKERQRHQDQKLKEWQKDIKEWEKNGKDGRKPAKTKKLKNFKLLTGSGTNELPNLSHIAFWIPFGLLFSDSPQNGLYKPSTDYGRGTNIIRIDDFYDGILIRLHGFKQVDLKPDEIDKYRLIEGQVLINRVNSIEYLGKCGLVRGLTSSTVFESNVMKVSLAKESVVPQYISHYLSSHLGARELKRNAKHAVNQASINQTDVSLTSVPICSLAEQTQIVQEIESRLSVCDKLGESIDTSLKQAEALRQSILKKAFEGNLLTAAELTACRKEPDWEPADKLLERIFEEKKNDKV